MEIKMNECFRCHDLTDSITSLKWKDRIGISRDSLLCEKCEWDYLKLEYSTRYKFMNAQIKRIQDRRIANKKAEPGRNDV